MISNNNIPQIFNYGSAAVRTVEKGGEVWFVAQDVADILSYGTAKDMVRILDEDEKSVICSLGANRGTTVINESGLYTLILRSNKAEAKPFRKWVTSVVLPTIRKTGGYVTAEVLNDPVRLRDMLRQQNDKVIELSEWKEVAIPKVEAYDFRCEKHKAIPLTLVAAHCELSSSVALTTILHEIGLFEYKQHGNRTDQYRLVPKFKIKHLFVMKGYTSHLRPQYLDTIKDIITNYREAA